MKFKTIEIKPVPGHAFVRLESLFQNTGKIIIPDAYSNAPMCVGRIVDISYSPNQQVMLNLEAIVPGIRVIMLPESGREIIEGEDVKDFTLEYHVIGIDNKKIKKHAIQAILGDDVKLGTQEQEIPRCKFCGNSKGVAQGIILWNGVCPRCHKDRYGKVHSAKPDVTVSEAEIERHKAQIFEGGKNLIDKDVRFV